MVDVAVAGADGVVDKQHVVRFDPRKVALVEVQILWAENLEVAVAGGG